MAQVPVWLPHPVGRMLPHHQWLRVAIGGRSCNDLDVRAEAPTALQREQGSTKWLVGNQGRQSSVVLSLHSSAFSRSQPPFSASSITPDNSRPSLEPAS